MFRWKYVIDVFLNWIEAITWIGLEYVSETILVKRATYEINMIKR